MRRDPMSVPGARTSAGGPAGVRAAPLPEGVPPDVPRAAPPGAVHGPSPEGPSGVPPVPSSAPPRRAGDKARWYAPVAVAVDAAGAGGSLHAVLAVERQPHSVGAAALAAMAWTVVRAAHRRYTRRQLGESRGLLGVLRDALSFAGLLAVALVVAGRFAEGPGGAGARVAPALVALAILPVPVFTGTCSALTHRHLTGQRRAAQAVRRALVVGEAGPSDRVVARLAAGVDHAYVVVGGVTLGAAEPVGGLSAPRTVAADDGGAVLAAAGRCGADLVLMVPGALLGGERLRRLAWAVHGAGLGVVVASGVSGVAQRRVRIETAAGLSLLHLAPPVRSGPQPAAKAVLDAVGAALGLLLLAPLLAVVAVAVRAGSPGPALYRQTRVGRGGAPFTMWKFRSMTEGAELERGRLAGADEQDGPMFKIRRDPRVTRVGRLLRRTSLDELPQLVNVLRGEMSLVGPRPPLPEEVARYDAAGMRRLSVKPGMTGPWQVGGRCELSWDESLALDLWYADNWSFTTDIDLLLRTVRAIVDGRGAY